MAHPIALITGASRGLGKQAALTLAARGVDLIITYRSQADDAAAVVAEATALGVKAHALPSMWPTAAALPASPTRCASC